MKLIPITLSLFFIVVFSSYHQMEEYPEVNLQQNNKLILSQDSLKKGKGYKILKSTPGLNYSVRKIGNGKTITFSVRNGNGTFPRADFFSNNGYNYSIGKKRVFDNVGFPFKCSISCQVNNNGRTQLASLLNDFQIEIYEPGTWEISFDQP